MEAKIELQQLNDNYPNDYTILTRLSIVHHYIGEKTNVKKIETENTDIAYEYISKAYQLNQNDPQVLKWYTVILGKTIENENLRSQIELSKKN